MARRPVVGLDIGTSSVRAAELRLGRSGVTLERFGQVALPGGAVRDGEVVDPDAVAAALRQLWSQVRFGTKKVVVGVASQKVVVRRVDLPWLPMDELRASLPFQVQDSIPIPVDRAALDVHPLEEFVSDTGARMLRVLLVAAARDTVDDTLAAVVRAGLQPTMVDLTSFAVLRSQAHVQGALPPVYAEALVDIGASVTNIIIHQGGTPRFVRILLMGGADITEAVSERLGVPLDQAEELKQSTGLTADPGLDDSPAVRTLEEAGGGFVEEVRGSIDYYLAQADSVRIERIVLSGGGSRLAGLAERLGTASRLPVEVAQPLSLLRIGKTGLSAEQLAYSEAVLTVPVGLALGQAS